MPGKHSTPNFPIVQMRKCSPGETALPQVMWLSSSVKALSLESCVRPFGPRLHLIELPNAVTRVQTLLSDMAIANLFL